MRLEEKARIRQLAILTPALKPRAAFVTLANRVLGGGGSLGLYKSTAMARMMQRDRSNNKECPKAPQTFEELVTMMPDRFKLTSDGKPFLKYAGPVSTKAGSPSMLLFMSSHGRARLEGSRTWFADGTFKTAPQGFQQVSNGFS